MHSDTRLSATKSRTALCVIAGSLAWPRIQLGVLGPKSKDLIGYTWVQFFIHFPIIMILAAILMTTFTYHAPALPNLTNDLCGVPNTRRRQTTAPKQ